MAHFSTSVLHFHQLQKLFESPSHLNWLWAYSFRIYWASVALFSIVKPTICTTSQIYFILEQHTTCFGRSLRPSLGV
jgi:hypothetical protein